MWTGCRGRRIRIFQNFRIFSKLLPKLRNDPNRAQMLLERSPERHFDLNDSQRTSAKELRSSFLQWRGVAVRGTGRVNRAGCWLHRGRVPPPRQGKSHGNGRKGKETDDGRSKTKGNERGTKNNEAGRASAQGAVGLDRRTETGHLHVRAGRRGRVPQARGKANDTETKGTQKKRMTGTAKRKGTKDGRRTTKQGEETEPKQSVKRGRQRSEKQRRNTRKRSQNEASLRRALQGGSQTAICVRLKMGGLESMISKRINL